MPSDRMLARLISGLESGSLAASAALEEFSRTGVRARVIGLSGPPGVGKSVLVARLMHAAVAAGHKPAVLMVDPTSPFTGGAVLGDRMRLQATGIPEGVFVRSLASRGALGGLSAVVPAAIRALEGAGYDLVLIETVGVGQNETDIVRVGDTVVVVQAPGAGDEVQGLKSGLLEIADVFVVNKCDLPGADQARAVLVDVARHQRREGWTVPIVSVSATRGEGIPDLWAALEQHRAWLAENGRLARRQQARMAVELTSAATAMMQRRIAELALVERLSGLQITIAESLSELFGLQDLPASGAVAQQRRR